MNLTLNRDPDGGIGSIELADIDGNLIALITTTDTTWIVSPIEGQTQEVVRTESDFAADSVLLGEAFEAYLSVTNQSAGQDPGSGDDSGSVDPPAPPPETPPDPSEPAPEPPTDPSEPAPEPPTEPEPTEGLCFAPGTRIATPTGETVVEYLAIGDLISTDDGKQVRVLWIGRQTLYPRRFEIPERLEPVRLRTGALGKGLPLGDLTVTADHGMIVDGLVINASALVNGTSIDFVPHAKLPDAFTVYHIETEAHDVIFANGAATETFVDYVGRRAFDNYAEYVDLYGAERIIPEMDRPRISAQRLVPDAIKARLGIVEPEFDWDAALTG